VITEIQEPLDLIPEMPADDISEPYDLSEEEEPDSDSEEMEENNDREEEREVPLQDNQPWLVGDVVASLDEYTISLGTQKSCSPSMILKPQDRPKIISRSSYSRSGL
jgi:hypothetical protein